VQLADLGHPVLGDPLYGTEAARTHPAARALGRLALHAARLSVELTPLISVEAPLPADFRRALQTLASGGTSPAP
jgi:23S rRNA pseudouridine1911/1915/1917 synthase